MSEAGARIEGEVLPPRGRPWRRLGCSALEDDGSALVIEPGDAPPGGVGRERTCPAGQHLGGQGLGVDALKISARLQRDEVAVEPGQPHDRGGGLPGGDQLVVSGADGQEDDVVFPRGNEHDVEARERADAGLDARAGGLEGGEVVGPAQAGGRLAHGGQVQPTLDAQRPLGATAGTSMVKEGEPLMRAWRDLIAVRTHHLLARDRTANNVGRMVVGLEPTSRLGCQLKVDARFDGQVVELPEATRNFYVDGHVPQPH